MNFVIMVICFVLLWVLRKRTKIPWWVRAALAFIGGSCLANTGVGIWLADRLREISNSLVDQGPVLVGGIALVVAVIVVYDIAVDRKADTPAKVGLILLPVLFLAAVGPLAGAGVGLSDAIADMGTNSLGKLIGG
ncbi:MULTISPECIES: hypothetical protein [Saccharopolyspora]|uniref:Uncharacterized protein n=1 Tax=Saccharopolyspora aridisoli TaxID=2530385 RepID=A0A4R4UGR8_9PSEU|nr:hypothetical protein [Saccharopolyspora aridisoli]TDC88134.1 hypothetical protein E1161_24370 [Saccharopolyspora aridisoli]